MSAQIPSDQDSAAAAPRSQPAANAPPWWYMPPAWWTQPPKRSLGKRLLRSLGIMIFVLSVLINVYLFVLIAASTGSRFGKELLRAGNEQQIVAVYNVSGIIEGRGAAAFSDFCREIYDKPAVKAVVIRVDSPGGMVSSSDQMNHDVKRLREKGKKVVVSMGGVAASGGYYISAPADEIFAEPTTITGSIGVIAEWFIFRGTLDKIGAEPVVLRSTDAAAWKDEISLFQHMSDVQRKHMQSVLDQMQQQFNQVVKDGRGSKLKTNTTEVTMVFPGDGKAATQPVKFKQTEPLNGKIYLPDEALKFGLIDKVGYLNDAIDQAAKLASLDKPMVVEFARRGGLFAFFRGQAPEPTLDVKAQIEKFQTPSIQLLWKVE